MKKIQVSTIEQLAQVEVIFVNASLVAKAAKTLCSIETMLEQTKHNKVEYNEETGTMDPVMDAKGNPVVEYSDPCAKVVDEEIYPFVKELFNAFIEG